jgi:hypothetical protein
MQVKVKFAQEVQHRQSEREYSRSLTQAQRYILRELGLLFKTTQDEEIRKQVNLLEQAFRQPITTVLKRELNLIKRRSLTGETLFSELKKLYTQHEMRDWLDRRRLQGEEQPIPMIVCSQALV